MQAQWNAQNASSPYQAVETETADSKFAYNVHKKMH